MTVRVLVVDDSPTMRALLSRQLGSDPEIEVVGAASCAAEARVMIREHNPDVVTLDIEMPGMNGLQFLEKIMRLRPMPVIIVSGITKSGCERTICALELGALDCYPKPQGATHASNSISLANIVKNAANASCSQPSLAASANRISQPIPSIQNDETRLIAIGASTGGVEALHHMLPAFPEDCPPTLIVQHIGAGFAPALADRLDQHCKAKVQLAEPGLTLQSGHIYIAPSNNRHMVLKGGNTLHVRSILSDSSDAHCPSVDALFNSVARTLGSSAVGILLTGMGADGARGLLAMRQTGARTIAQDQASSVIYGMPRAAAELNAAELILPLTHIAAHALSGVLHRSEINPKKSDNDFQPVIAVRN